MIMNKKGFTLPELLGVIVVLSVIIGIAGMSVLSIMNKTKNKTFKEMEDNLKDAAITCYLDRGKTEECDTASKLINAGYFEDNKNYCNNVELTIIDDDNDIVATIIGKCGN